MVDTGDVRWRLEVVRVSVRCYGGHRCCEMPSWGRPCVCEVLWWTQVLWDAVLRSSLRCYGGHRCCEVPSWGRPCVCEVLWWTQVLWDAVLRSSLRCYGGHRCCEVPSWGRPCVCEVLWWTQVLWDAVLRSSLRCYGGHRCCEVPSWGRPCVCEVLWWTQVLWGTVFRLSVCLWGVMVGTGAVRYRLEVVPMSLRCYGGHRCCEVPSWGCPCVCEVLWWTQVLWGTVLRLPLCLWGVMVDTGAVRYRLGVVPVSLKCHGGHRCCEVPSICCPCSPEVSWWTQVLWGTVLRLSLCSWGVIVDTGAVRYRLEVVPVSLRCYSGHRCCEVPSWGLSLCLWGVMVDTGAVRYRLEVVPVPLRCYSGHRYCEVPSWGCPCVPEVLWWTQVLWGTVLRLSLCSWGVIVDTGAVTCRLEVVPVSLRCYGGHRCCEVPSWGRPCVPEVL